MQTLSTENNHVFSSLFVDETSLDVMDEGYAFHEPIPSSIVDHLRKISEREKASSLAIFLTAFSILLYRYTRGETEVTVRISVLKKNARFRFAAQSRFSHTTLTRQLSIPLQGNLTLRQAFQMVSAVISAAFPSEWSPALLADEDAKASVTFEWQEPGAGNGNGISLTLHSQGGLTTDISYWRLLSLPEPILQVGKHWHTLLASFESGLDANIMRLPILDADALQEVLYAFRGRSCDQTLIRQECLHQIFEAHALAHPERVALSCAGREITYGELDQQANQLARYLRAQGVGRGSYVAMMFPRSTDVYLSILAILKTGAAYVPIDAEYPPDRVAYILQDCNCSALLTTASSADILPSTGCPVVCLDRDHEAIARVGSQPIEGSGVGPGDVAYVIYTSGSTGRPKGVQIEHQSVCNLVRAESQLFQVQPQDRIYQGFSIAFDASVEEVWLAFASGGTLVVGTHEMVHAGPALAKMLSDERVTILSCVPTLLSMMDEDIPSIRLLILGGESCPKDLVARWWNEGRRVVNTYGPTEATVIATCADLHPDQAVTIGKPIPNYTAYVLDDYRQPVPIGVPGELCIGGIGLSRGYMNRPDLTDERFIPNPFADSVDTSARLYRTGDLVRFTPEGDIDFLGRIDAQVKLRGFRVELAEIESVLMQCPSVQSAVVAVREDIPGIQQLAAYLIPQQDRAFDESAAKSYLRSRLPAYMMPSCYVTLEEFPTLPSGKVDRKRLPAPAISVAAPSQGAQLPREGIEGKILTIWEKLFNPQSVSVQDNFFDLGGHSLLAARMVSELRKDPQMRDVAMLDIYRHPTLEDFARRVAEIACTTETSTTADVDEHRCTEPVQTFHAASRLAYYACAAAQLLGIFAIMLVVMPTFLLAYHVYLSMLAHQHSILASLFGGLLSVTLVFPLIVLLSIASKWLLIGKYQAGDYPLWGWFYLRFWFVRRMQALLPLAYLRGTPLLPLYFRAMGASIGRNVYIGTHQFAVFDLLSIGDDSSIGMEADLPGYIVQNGMMHLGPITIGARCYVGTKSVIHTDTVMEDDARLDELSMLPSGSLLPHGEGWSGSPARPVEQAVVPGDAAARPEPATQNLIARAGYSLFYLASIVVILPMFMLLAGLPGMYLFLTVIDRASIGWALAATPLLAALFVVVFCLEIAVAKALLLGKVREGSYRVQSLFYLRKWLVDGLMQMALEILHSLYATLYLVPWFRLLGAKLGKRVEISTVAHITPELLEIDSESFIADSACLGATRVHLGRMFIAATRIGKRTFIGNSALVSSATTIGDNCLIGCLSVPPSKPTLEATPHSSWLGSPSVLLPRRQASASFPERVVFNPPWYLYLCRGFIEFFRVTIPATLASLQVIGLIASIIYLEQSMTPVKTLLLLPFVSMALTLLLVLFVIGMKWIVMGRYRPCTKPLWSSFVWRTEMITAFHECFAAPVLLNTLQGTPFLAPYFRLMGSRIGKRVYMETTQITEFDHVIVGNDVALNLNCTLQTHLFEDRVIKTSYLRIGDKSTVGPMAVVLYDSEMQEGASLNGLSLLMKGETLPSWSHWEGIPARRGN